MALPRDGRLEWLVHDTAVRLTGGVRPPPSLVRRPSHACNVSMSGAGRTGACGSRPSRRVARRASHHDALLWLCAGPRHRPTRATAH